MKERLDDIADKARRAGADAYDHAGEKLKATGLWARWKALAPIHRRLIVIGVVVLVAVVAGSFG